MRAGNRVLALRGYGRRAIRQGTFDMRLIVAAMLTTLLAACGSGEPPGVEFERPVASVYNTIAAVDGRVDMEGLLKTPVVARRQVSNNELVFLLGKDGAENRGQVTFQFLEPAEGRTRVTVDAEIPEIKANIGGSMKILSEAKIESLLAERLRALAKRMKGGGLPLAELEELDQAIAFTALALDPEEVNRAIALAGNSDALAAALEREFAWNADGASDYADAASAMDDASGADAYGDDAGGSEATGDEALGTDIHGDEPEPEPDFYSE
jgi:hypothetical protein